MSNTPSKEQCVIQYKCLAKERVITIRDGILFIGSRAFEKASKIVEIQLPSTITTICDHAFTGCDALQTINMPAGVQTIGSVAFDGCNELHEIELPSSLSACTGQETFVAKDGTAVEKTTYYNPIGRCYSLSNVVVSDEQPNYCFENGLLLSKDRRVLYACTNAITSEVFRVPDSIVEIAAYAFSGNNHIKKVICNQILPYISSYAFARNESIQTVEYGDGVMAIHTGAFAESSIEELAISPFIRTIGQGAFCQCFKLKKLCIPATVDSVSTYNLCKQCQSLERFHFAASWCPTIIDCSAFDGCDKLEEVTFDDDCKLDTIGRFAFSSCTALGRITIPASVRTIDKFAFRGCTALQEIRLSAGLAIIGDNAFENCTALRLIDLPSTLTAIGANAFVRCSALGKIIIPASVRQIGWGAFWCGNLKVAHIPSALALDAGFSPAMGFDVKTTNIIVDE